MKSHQKIISIIFFILFIIIFSYYNLDEYKTFHLQKINTEKNQLDINNKINNFEVKNIQELNDTKLFYTPNKELLWKIIEHINNAKNEIYLETYMLTETRIQDALIKAKERWVKIQIILEKSPYMSYNINNKAYDYLTKKWIKVVRSNKDNYSLNHSKVLLIDGLSIVSTWNYTYSTFTKNRDFFVFTSDKNINDKLKQNFSNDYLWEKINIYDNNLIFSPNSSRIKFEKLFKSADKNIKMYFQYVLDDNLVEQLINLKLDKNIDIEIILPITAKDDENTKKLEKNWVKISIQKKWTMHAKAILIDEKYLFIWSINFSENSIDNNREIWILIINQDIINQFLEIFYLDIKNND